MTEESAVKVCVRVRPLIAREECSTSSSLENEEPPQHFWKADQKSIHQIEDGIPTKSFSFDRVFTSDESTNQLYQTVAKPLVVSTVGGYNGTIFAYGQTSSGKTFTMMGNGHGGTPGVIPLAVEEVFQSIKNFPNKEFLLRVSYMEIYNETVADLLVDSWKRKPLEVREGMNKNVYVADLTEELVTSPAQALAWIRKGEKNRHYGKTRMNQRSSRSHTIFRMILESRERSDPASGENADGAIIVSHLNLVDLAGSERTSQTGAEGARLKEGCNINRSLFTLGQVMKKLTDENQKGFTNYRDSKLTRILQNSLGGNAKTVIICTITPVALEETLSTLQFASTAKKMKNDPHVTEVSDDGALLKRYRNEIVDLKRRLHEVSSVTQTTATEKKVLSQLLQEKEMLQREQEDRIKNLTKLLVTSSNQIPVVRMPKRRVTWGGKMLKLAGVSACDDHPSDHHFAQSFIRKRKADRSCLSVMCEDDEEFDSQWEIPDEPPDEMETSQASGTVQSFGDSPNNLSNDWMSELSSKVWNLELQLDTESRQKEEAMRRVENLNCRVAELELPQGNKEHPEDRQATEQRVAALELQLQTAAEEKEEAVKKAGTLELRVAELERQSHGVGEANEQTRREFAETIQLCEALASEKESVVAERDYLKQELGMFLEQTEILEKEKATLSKELRENRELDEFKSLEEEFRKDQEKEFQDEISNVKRTLQASEAQCQELQNKLESMSEQLKKKTEFAEELQNMSGKDLVQEVAKLRRSLDDAEGLSMDTKKEWAHLRSEKLALQEVNVTLSANHEKMEAEVNGLRVQLESEKSRYMNMQRDLQKELNVTFEENTKLTSLLEGKVPKNLTDNLELEKTVARLNKDLTASREAEETLRAQLESLPAQMDLRTQQVCGLSEELYADRTQRDQLLSVEAQRQEEAGLLRDSLQTAQEELAKTQADLGSASLREDELRHQCGDVEQKLESLNLELQRCKASVEERSSQLEESEQDRASLEGKVSELQQLSEDLEEKLSDSEVSRSTEEVISKELQQQVKELKEELQQLGAERKAVSTSEELRCNVTSLTAEREQLQEHMGTAAATQSLVESLQLELQAEKQKSSDLVQLCEQKELDAETRMLSLSQELQCVREEKDAAVKAAGQKPAQGLDELRSTLDSVSAERDQLKLDLQENVDLMIEIQDDMRKSLEKNVNQKKLIKHLEAAIASKPQEPSSDVCAPVEELQAQMKTLSEELEAERAALLSEKEASGQSSTQETEELQQRVMSLSEERDQLQKVMEALRQEKQQLTARVDDTMETVTQLSETLQTVREEKKQLEDDMQQNVQAELQEQKNMNSDVERQTQEKESLHAQQIRDLSEELQRVEAERAALLSEKEASGQSSTQETEELQQRVTSLSEERDQLQKVMEALRQEKQQLTARVDDTMETVTQLSATLQTVREDKKQLEDDMQQNVQAELQEQKNMNSDVERQTQEKESLHAQQIRDLSEELQRVEAERAALLSEKEASGQSSTQETEELQQRVTSLSEERDQLQEVVEALRQEKRQLTTQLDDTTMTLHSEMKTMSEELQRVEAERAALLSEKEASGQSSTQETEELQERVTSLSEERDQLQEVMEALRQEKQQLTARLDDTMETVTQLSATLQTVREEKKQLEDDMQQNVNMVCSTHELLTSVQAELQEQKNMKSDVERQTQEKESFYAQQIRELSKELQRVEAERAAVLSEKKASGQSSTQETEELQQRVTSLSEERDQLQEVLEALRQEKQQLTARLDDTTMTLHSEMKTLSEELQRVEAEKAALLSEKEASGQSSTQETKELQQRVTSLSEERDQLQEVIEALRQEKQQLTARVDDTMETVTQLSETLQTVREEKKQLEDDMQQNVNMVCSTQQLLTSVQAQLQEQENMKSDVERQTQEKESFYAQQIRELSEELQRVEAERAAVLSEKKASGQSSTQETEELQQRVTSLSEERDQLQEVMEALRQEKRQLTARLDDTIEMMSEVQEKLRQQHCEAQEREAALQQQVQQLEDQQATAEAKTEATRQEVHEAHASISALTEQLDSARRHPAGFRQHLSDRLQDSTKQLQVIFGKFERMVYSCSLASGQAAVVEGISDLSSLTESFEISLPKSTTDVFDALRHVGEPMVQSIMTFAAQELLSIQNFRDTVQQLMEKEVEAYEERQLKDVLMYRAQAPPHSVEVQDFHELWEQRLVELLDRRQTHLQRVDGTIETLTSGVQSFMCEIRDEIGGRVSFKSQLYPELEKKPVNISLVDGLLKRELERRTAAAARSERSPRQSITAKHWALFNEMKELEVQAGYELMSEKSKNKTLLEARGGAHLKTEVSLLLITHEQTQKLQQAGDKVKALCVENEELKEAQVRATSRASNHKETTQLLQTELQDSRALVEEKDKTIQTLRGKLRESESKVSPSAAELGNLRTKLTQMEAMLRSASDEHHKEMKKMSTRLSEGEEAQRKLRETLRKSQQEGEDSILQGKDLHARLTNPRGLTIKTSVQLEKTKLEEEVKQLREKLPQLESLVTNQQAEINKWKSRALKLKSRAVTGRPQSPSATTTPTKRGFTCTNDPSSLLCSPKKFLATPRKGPGSPLKVHNSLRELLNSPKALESPKSQFFDVAGNSEMLNWTRPTQFFDNSSLGTIPDGAMETENKEVWWPLSPKQEKMCKTQ